MLIFTLTIMSYNYKILSQIEISFLILENFIRVKKRNWISTYFLFYDFYFYKMYQLSTIKM